MKPRPNGRFPFHRRPDVGSFTRVSRRSRRRAARLTRALTLAFAALALLSLVMLSSILLRSLHTKRLSTQLAARHSAEKTPAVWQPSAPPSAPGEQALPAAPAGDQTPLAPEAFIPQDDAAQEDAAQAEPAAFHRVGGAPLSHMETLYEQNHDLVAWLTIPDVLDLPVVFRDNRYYLTHDFNRRPSAAGTLFWDEHHRFAAQTQNLLLHGHNMKDGTMFGRLTHYLQDIAYYQSHPLVQLDTLWEREEYVVFAVLRVPLDVQSDQFVNYFSHPTFAGDEPFDAYVRQLQLHSVYAIPIDAQPSDALLTLSTCIDEDRLVLVCRRLREGETHAGLRALARLAQAQ